MPMECLLLLLSLRLSLITSGYSITVEKKGRLIEDRREESVVNREREREVSGKRTEKEVRDCRGMNGP